VTAEEANQVIMAARVSVYGDDVIAPEPEVDPDAEVEEVVETPAEIRSAELATAEAVFAPANPPVEPGE
jgi:hypothetical protein